MTVWIPMSRPVKFEPGCCLLFQALLPWRKPTGHNLLHVDEMSSSCGTSPAPTPE